MNTANENDTRAKAAATPPRGKRRLRRWLIIAAALFVLLLLVVLLLPTLLSTGLGRGLVVGQVNKRLNGELTVRDWSLGYFSDTRVAGLKLADPEKNTVVEVEEITIPRGLLAFTGSKYDLGEMTVQAPKVTLLLHKDGTTNLSNLVAAAPPGKKAETKAAGPETTPQPLGIDVFGTLVLTNGEVTLKPDEGEAFTMRDLSVNVKLDGLDNPIVISQSAKLGKNRTPMKLDVTATAFKQGMPAGEDLQADVKLGLDEFSLASLAGIMQAFNVPLQTAGEVTMSLEASVKGLKTTTAKGAVAFRELSVSGAPLKGDRLQMESVRFDFDLARDGERIAVNAFTLDSPLAQVEAAGVLNLPRNAPLPTGALKSKVRVDLAGVAAQLPRTLNLQPGLAINRGALALDADLAAQGKRTEFTTRLEIKDLAATRDGKQIRLDQPVTLTAAGVIDENKPEITELKFDSSFCRLEGKGTLKQMNLVMAVDLAAATSEAAKFVDLKGKRAAGQMGMALNVTGDKPTAKNLDLVLDLDNVVLAGILKQDTTVPKTNIKLNALARLNDKFAPQGMTDLKVQVSAQRLAEIVVTADAITFGPGLPTVEQAKINLNARLDNALAFARNFAPLPGIHATGNAEVRLLCQVRGNTITAEQINVLLKDLDFAQNDKHIRERELQLAGAAAADLATRKAELKNLVLTCSPGKVTVASLLLPDWSHAPDGVTAEVRGDLDLDKTMAMAGDFVQLPPKLKLSGGATEFTLKVLLKDRKQKLDAAVALNDLTVQVEDKPPLAEKRVTVAVAGWVNPQAEKVDIDFLAVHSEALSLTAVAGLTQFRTRQNLSAHGTHTIDFGKLSPLVQAYSKDMVALTGKREQKFDFTAPLASTKPGELLQKMLAGTELYLANATIWGIKTDTVTIPISAKDGAATVSINATANEGRVNLPLNVTLGEKGKVLTIPDNTVVLNDARLDSDLADHALARLAPIFKNCVVNRGRIGYTSHHLKIPLERDQVLQMDAAGQLTLKGVELAAAPMVTDLLKEFGVGIPALKLPDQDVKIAIKGGSVQQSMLEIGFKQYKMFLSGTVGLDGKNLDMKADVPITREIVRKFGGNDEIFELLKGEMILVPLKGSTSLVHYPKDLIAANVKRLLSTKVRDRLIDKGLDTALDKLLKRRQGKDKDKDESKQPDKKQINKDVDTILKSINDLF